MCGYNVYMKATGKQLAEKVMHFRPYHRYYGIFAINPKNENDIWGYVENSFSMGWSRHCVSLYCTFTDRDLRKRALKECKEDYSKSDEDLIKRCKEAIWPKNIKYKEGMTVEEAKKALFDAYYEYEKFMYGRQNVWNLECKARGLYVPKGYVPKVFRLNSTKLPIIVDLRYRTASWYDIPMTYHKWYYRNAHFWIKDLNPGKVLENTGWTHINMPQDQYNGNTERVYDKTTSYKRRVESEKEKVLSRSQKKILKKQKRCKLAAEKGSPDGVGTYP